MKKQCGPQMALRIGLLRASALQNDGRVKPVILQRRTPQETNPKGHWGPNLLFHKLRCPLGILVVVVVVVVS